MASSISSPPYNLREKIQKNRSTPGGRQVSSNARGDSKTLPYPQPPPLKNEGTLLDVDQLVSNLREDPELRAWYTHIHHKSDSDFYQWFDEHYESTIRSKVGTVVKGARPISTDTTVRFAHIPSNIFGDLDPTPSLTVRWWFGHQFGYNFDLINPETQLSVHTPCGLSIEYWERGCWLELLSVTEGMRRCNGGIHSIEECGPPRWLAEPGAKLRFLWKDGRILGEAFVPRAPKGEPMQYEPFEKLADAMGRSV